jgi:hypothetical protein
MDKETTIPFGAKDSELKGWEYTIPENMEAEIKDGKIIVRPKGSEDEGIRKEMIKYFSQYKEDGLRGVDITPWIAYLERQKEQKSAEWSENDKRMLDDIDESLFMYEAGKNDYTREQVERERKWLKSLPERFNPQPKQELSSEEKNKLNRIYSLIRSATEKGNRPLIGDNEANELQGFLTHLSERFK